MTPQIALKDIIASFSHRFGVLKYLRSRREHNSALILMYHRVLGVLSAGADFVQPGMYVSTETFRCHMRFLKEVFNVLPLAELVERIESDKCVSGCCAITFDDGWLDNYTHAFPVLQELQIPATIFLATNFIGTDRMFWPEELSYYLSQPEVMALAKINPLLQRIYTDNITVKYLDNAIQFMKTYSPVEREELLSHLRSTNVSTHPKRMLMNWDEAKHMQASGLINFDAHTANHAILDQISLDEAEEEIITSRNEIEQRLGRTPEFFAYPNGNYSDDLKALLKRNGFRGAVTTRKGWLDKDVGLFEIPRIGMHEDVSCTIPLFYARIVLERF